LLDFGSENGREHSLPVVDSLRFPATIRFAEFPQTARIQTFGFLVSTVWGLL
jgi:hypothetical protein